ncbi:MAG: hypothetical protein JWM43_461 [Acidobacteriaceae bacterium]|nr:hypothetical protein [Acidobacteriaceae bacterium]
MLAARVRMRGFIASTVPVGALRCLVISILSILTLQAQPVPTSAAPTRDPAAIALVQRSLAVLGGAPQWAQLHSAVISGSLSRNGISKSSVTATWEDDWTDMTIRSRRDFTENGVTTTRINSSASGAFMRRDGKTQKLPNFVEPATLPTNLPAVSLMIAMANPAYSIVLVKGTVSDPGDRVVLVRYDAGKANLRTKQEWFFSSETAVPTQVNSYADDGLHIGHLLKTEVFYRSFQAKGGVSVPEQILVKEPNGTILTVTITSITLGSSRSLEDFQP